MTMTNNRLVWWLSGMAGLSTIAGGSQLAELTNVRIAGFAALVVGALQSATAAFVAGRKPLSNGQSEDTKG